MLIDVSYIYSICYTFCFFSVWNTGKWTLKNADNLKFFCMYKINRKTQTNNSDRHDQISEKHLQTVQKTFKTVCGWLSLNVMIDGFNLCNFVYPVWAAYMTKVKSRSVKNISFDYRIAQFYNYSRMDLLFYFKSIRLFELSWQS
jgi:hypothetical protein